MWVVDYTLLWIALRTAIIYIAVVIGIRLSGKREVGQMTPFDLVLLILIANAVQNAMTGPDTSVTGGLVAAGTLLILNRLVTRIVSHNKGVRDWVEGTSTVLVQSGKTVSKSLEKEHITPDELQQAFREHGVESLSDVSLAVLEIDGSISVLRKDEMPTTARSHHRIRFIRRAK